MGLGRFSGALCVVVAAIPLLGCSVTLSPAVVERGFVSSPNWAVGGRFEATTHFPSHAANGITAGFRMDHLGQITPSATYDRSRWEVILGYSVIPRTFRQVFGYELLGRVGIARGAMGGIESTPLAFSTGSTFAFLIRLSPSRFGADEVLRYTLLFVPQLDLSFAAPIEGAWQLQVGGALGVRFFLDSTLLP